MKNQIKKIIICFITVSCLFSCSNNKKVLTGKWEMSRTIKTELRYAPDDPTAVFGYFYMKQIIQYDFSENKYCKTIEQKFIRTEFIGGPDFLTDEQKADIENSLSSMNSIYVIKGDFTQKSNSILFNPLTCSKDGIEETFAEACKKDPKLEAHSKASKYSFKNDELIISDEVGNLGHFKICE